LGSVLRRKRKGVGYLREKGVKEKEGKFTFKWGGWGTREGGGVSEKEGKAT